MHLYFVYRRVLGCLYLCIKSAMRLISLIYNCFKYLSVSHNYTTFFLLVYKKRTNLNLCFANTKRGKNAIKNSKSTNFELR